MPKNILGGGVEAEVSVKETSDLGHVQNWKVFELWRVFGPLAFGQDMPRLPDIEQNGMREVPNLRSRLACPLRNRPTARCPVGSKRYCPAGCRQRRALRTELAAN